MNEHLELKTNHEIAMYLHRYRLLHYNIIIYSYYSRYCNVYILCQLTWLTFAILEFYSLISYHIQLFAEYNK